MDNPITVSLPQDLPTNWTQGQIIGPNGTDVGLTQQHGYNYLMTQVNAAQQAAEEVGEAFTGAASQADLTAHINNKSNPHSVTAEQVGADPSGSASAVQTNLTNHINNKNNPHGVTAEQAGADPAGSAQTVQGNLTTHINDTNNPHNVTASQVGAYTKPQSLQASTAALYGLTSSAVPNDVLSILSRAAVYNSAAATAQIGTLDVGTVIYLNENGSPVPYIIVNQGIPTTNSLYDSSCNGTWVLRQDIYENAAWDAGDSNVLPGADIFTTMAAMLSLYDSDVQSAIKTVIIPYCIGGGSSVVHSSSDGLQCKIFPLSAYEVGFTTSTTSYIPIDGAKLAYFDSGIDSAAKNKRIAKFNGAAEFWWLRSQHTSYSYAVWGVSNGGGASWQDGITGPNGIRPAFILPATFTSYYVLPGNGLYDVLGNLLFSLPGVQIVSGSYTGTGTYGSSNPNSLTFDFPVAYIIFVGYKSSSDFNPLVQSDYLTYNNPVFQCFAIGNTYEQSAGPYLYESSSNAYAKVSSDRKTVYWYNTSSSDRQLNGNNNTYYFIAFSAKGG